MLTGHKPWMVHESAGPVEGAVSLRCVRCVGRCQYRAQVMLCKRFTPFTTLSALASDHAQLLTRTESGARVHSPSRPSGARHCSSKYPPNRQGYCTTNGNCAV